MSNRISPEEFVAIDRQFVSTTHGISIETLACLSAAHQLTGTGDGTPHLARHATPTAPTDFSLWISQTIPRRPSLLFQNLPQRR